ncbi:MAG: DUF362 domain-containing protein [Prevotellaceae bacterium]|jgi:uncharacterized protein (DUF362 family)|nr:DUF362 domain-containing protein [Prevotellaceae bacterium]
MKRRNFLKTALFGGIAGTLTFKPYVLSAKPVAAAAPYDLVAVMGGEPAAMYAKAIESFGGISSFVKKGQRVVVKPNIGWDKTPEYAANTNPALVAAIIKDCLKAGASEVVVFDHTCDDWKACYKNSGIEDAVKEAGGKMAFAHEEKYYREITLPGAKRLTSTKVHEAILNADVWINVPILKNHGGAKMSIAMKNNMGIVWDRRFMHANDLQQCIADSALIRKKPALNIVDAYRIMTQNGPKGRSLSDVQTPKALFMSTDIVAIDTAAVSFFNQFKKMPLASVGHITIGHDMKIGTTDIDTLKVQRIKL